MAEQRDRQFPEPVSPDVFFLLYKGAIDVSDETRAIENAFLVLSLGRLGLRPNTLVHLHEGWIDWKAGLIEIPVHEPCVCDRCSRRVRADNGGEISSEIVAEKQWSPPGNGMARSVPFEWSRRVTGVIAEFFDRFDHVEIGDIDARLQEIASDASGVDPTRITPEALGSSSAVCFSDLGYDAENLAQVMGVVDPSELDHLGRRGLSPARPDGQVPPYLLRGRYRIALQPAQFPEEPFDPEAFDMADRISRAADRITSSRTISNPRGDGDGGVNRLPRESYISAESNLVTLQDGSVESLVSAWVHRQDNRASSSSEPIFDTAPETEESDDEAVDEGVEQSAETEQTDEAGPGTRPVGPDMVLGDARFKTTAQFVSDSITGGSAITGIVGIAESQLVFEIESVDMYADALSFVLPVETVIDFSLTYSEDRIDRETVAVAARFGEEKIILSIGLDERSAFSTHLFGEIFTHTPAVITHPQREGGRVIDDAETRPALLEVTRDGIELRAISSMEDDPRTVTDADLISVVNPETVMEVDTCLQRYDTTSWKSVEATHISASTDTKQTTRIGFDSPQHTKLLKKFLKQQYKRQMQRIRTMTMSASQKQFLVGIHSFQAGSMDPMQLADMMGLDDGKLSQLLESMVSKGLVTDTDSPDLTPLGRIAATEKLDDVNI